MVDFMLYSTEITATLTPNTVTPSPATLVPIKHQPFFGEYEEPNRYHRRGSVHPTLGGVQVQDFGPFVKDGRIKIVGTDAMEETIVTAVQGLNNSSGTEYYFTDTFNVWKVQFSRPNGFSAFKNLLCAVNGRNIYSYEINLIVLALSI